MGFFRVWAWPAGQSVLRTASSPPAGLGALARGAAGMQGVYGTHPPPGPAAPGGSPWAGLWPQPRFHTAGPPQSRHSTAFCRSPAGVGRECRNKFPSKRDPKTASLAHRLLPAYLPSQNSSEVDEGRSRSTEGRRSASCRLSGRGRAKTRSASLQGLWVQGPHKRWVPGMAGPQAQGFQEIHISGRRLVLRSELWRCRDSVPGFLKEDTALLWGACKGHGSALRAWPDPCILENHESEDPRVRRPMHTSPHGNLGF